MLNPSRLPHSQLLQVLPSLISGLGDLGIYIHVPFCRKRCNFCAFYLMVYQGDRVANFLRGLKQEIRLWGEELGQVPVSTVYFGGGTPTVLDADQLISMLEEIANNFLLRAGAEITVEASPDTVTFTELNRLLKAGVNRLSLGAQSFDESEWKQLGRLGNRNTIRKAVEKARHVGFQNVNIDVMYGLPEQTLESWAQSLKEAISLNPSHISCYALTLEEGTRFYAASLRGEIRVGDSELENSMYQSAISYLTQIGYQHYEISNFCQPQYECRHNIRYWSGHNYLGLGPSAQSFIGFSRFGNVEDLNEYCRLTGTQQFPLASCETLSKEALDRERVVFGLRLINGIDLKTVNDLILDESWQFTVQQLIKEGFLSEKGNILQLTKNGQRFADSVAVQLL